MPAPPVVLVIAGHDPSGAAGIQADIETITANGCRCVSVITATTAQNTSGFATLYPQAAARFSKQARLLTSDIRVHACKIGLIGSAALVESIAALLTDLPTGTPVVFDPVLAAGSGEELADRQLVRAMKARLLPHTTVLTPNAAEARRLAHRRDIRESATVLMRRGCRAVLVTGADEPTAGVDNMLFSRDMPEQRYHWQRLPGVFHGSGCTLSSALAAGLAQGMDIGAAVARAQDFTWQSLAHGLRLGAGQIHPNRFFRQKDR